MPGARLTHADRRQIAAWLAEGLGYAEIARRLDRPTSTISREVARNGEPGDYRPDHAQQATTHRARQRRSMRAAGDARPVESVSEFVEQFALVLAATGFPRMTARVFVSLLTSDSGSATAAGLVGRLRVSPASVSKSIGQLERMDLVVRGPDPGRRRERYVIVDDVWLRAWRTDTGAHARVADAARRGAAIFGADTPVGARLGDMGRFFTWLSGQMSDSTLAVDDALTLLAALVHAARPLDEDELAAALGWPRKRVTEALDAIEGRLSPAQREALG